MSVCVCVCECVCTQIQVKVFYDQSQGYISHEPDW